MAKEPADKTGSLDEETVRLIVQDELSTALKALPKTDVISADQVQAMVDKAMASVMAKYPTADQVQVMVDKAMASVMAKYPTAEQFVQMRERVEGLRQDFPKLAALTVNDHPAFKTIATFMEKFGHGINSTAPTDQPAIDPNKPAPYTG